MKKEVILEISRISELLGVKKQINEQISSFIKSLVPALQDDLLNVAKAEFKRVIKSIDDLSESELQYIIKTDAAKIVRQNLYAEMTSKMVMNASKFESKTTKMNGKLSFIICFLMLFCIGLQTNAQYNLIVAKDGSGDYTTVQAAINAAPTSQTTPYKIFIKKLVFFFPCQNDAMKKKNFFISFISLFLVISFILLV